jgi:hypothetical protein
MIITNSSVIYYYQNNITFNPFILISVSQYSSSCLGTLYSQGNTLIVNQPLWGIQTDQNSYISNSYLLSIYLNNKAKVQYSFSPPYQATLSVINSSGNYKLPNILYSGDYKLNQTINYNLLQNLVLSLNFSPYQNVIYNYKIIENFINPQSTILNLINGNNYFGKIYYLGVNNGKTINLIPYFTQPNSWSNYYQRGLVLLGYPSSYNTYSTGMLIINFTYSGTGNVSILFLGAYSYSSNNPADGYEVYFFLKPPKYSNQSFTYFVSSQQNKKELLPVQGQLIFPDSTTSYFMIQWDPYWIESGKSSSSTFNVFIVTPGKNNKVNNLNEIKAYGPLGAGGFKLNPSNGNLIGYFCFFATYNPSSGYIYASVTYLPDGRTATLSYYIGLNYPAGTYSFAIAASSDIEFANWGIVYWTIY